MATTNIRVMEEDDEVRRKMMEEEEEGRETDRLIKTKKDKNMDKNTKNVLFTGLSPERLRLGFIRKVYGILAAQLVLTCVVCYAFMYSPSINAIALRQSNAIVWPSFFVTLGILFALHCYKTQHPTNLYLLFGFTLMESFILGVVCAAYESAGYGFLILQAAGITATIFLSLTAFTFYSRYDFGFLRMYLFAGLVGLLVFGLFCALFGFRTPYLYSLFGAMLFCGYIVFDTWQLSKKYAYDEYVPAAIDLYLDIVNLFLYVLDLLGRRR